MKKENKDAEITRLKLQVSQVTIQRDNAQKERKALDDVNRSLNTRRLRMYDSLMLEKIDLLGRIGRIDQRICALGLTPAETASAEMSLDGVKVRA